MQTWRIHQFQSSVMYLLLYETCVQIYFSTYSTHTSTCCLGVWRGSPPALNKCLEAQIQSMYIPAGHRVSKESSPSPSSLNHPVTLCSLWSFPLSGLALVHPIHPSVSVHLYLLHFHLLNQEPHTVTLSPVHRRCSRAVLVYASRSILDNKSLS